jgi:6-phosphofructokinase 2
MIYTITLNPALDRTLWIDKIKEDISNRIVNEQSYAGGKSIDVSKVLKNFGVDNTALGFVAGFAGMELEGRLLNEGIHSDFVKVSGETRINIIIHEKETGKQLAFNARGPEVQPHELMQLVEKIDALPDPEVVTIGGSLPPGASPEIYRRIITVMKSAKAKVVLDVDGEGLKAGLKAKPDIIKPNIHELSALVGRELKGLDEVVAAARDLNQKGVGTVLVSMGARGILLVSGDEQHLAVPPEVKVSNTIGAGDSSVAGFVFGLISGKSLSQSLAYAAAAGTATTLRQGTALCQRDDFERILPQVKLSILPKGA